MTLLLLLNAQGDSGIVVSFPRLTPSARYDDTPWTQVKIEEAASVDGTYTELITANITPVDDDAKSPQPRAITVVGVTRTAGWYRVTFIDDDEGTEQHPPIYMGASYKPSVDEIAMLMLARVKAKYDYTNTFDETTRPTGSMVAVLIDQATALIMPSLGIDGLDARFWPSARAVIALQTALLVEPGYFPEQQQLDKTAWEQWDKMLSRSLPALVTAVAEDLSDGGGDGTGATLHSFPPPTCWDF